MGLTPEEIAQRAFTPSADGYHQGEVRSFLERVASQLQILQDGLPEGRVELMELTAALQSHEPRLDTLTNKLDAAVAQLAAATTQLQETQAETTAQLTSAQALTNQQRQATQELASLSKQPATSEGSTNPSAASIATPPASTPAPTTSSGTPPSTPNSKANALPPPPEPNPTASALPPPPEPNPTASAAASEVAEAADPLSLFGSDFDSQPLFSDNANDLLDGVLDDVMETINDEGTPS